MGKMAQLYFIDWRGIFIYSFHLLGLLPFMPDIHHVHSFPRPTKSFFGVVFFSTFRHSQNVTCHRKAQNENESSDKINDSTEILEIIAAAAEGIPYYISFILVRCPISLAAKNYGTVRLNEPHLNVVNT